MDSKLNILLENNSDITLSAEELYIALCIAKNFVTLLNAHSVLFLWLPSNS